MRQLSQIYLLLLLVSGLNGCTTIGYYSQAIDGHMSLMLAGEPVDELISSNTVSPELQRKLLTVRRARLFAVDTLELPAGGAFTDYVELDRPWVVVNLIAVPEFSLEPHRWCYPVLGCQAYRGYFSLKDAQREQAAFREDGYDTFIGGVSAYSTLGWFDDPVHSGFTRLSEERMVALMFHELAHRVIYIDDDTAFNESFATAVELEGLRLWLTLEGNSAAFQRALERLQQRDQTVALVQKATNELAQLYRQQENLPLQQLRQRKSDILTTLLRSYNQLSEHWNQPGPLGRSPAALNNANLALFQQYNQYVTGFRQLLRDNGDNFPAFYRSVAKLSEKPADERIRALNTLSERFEEYL
ncbi:zinc protease [Marinobacter salinus]|uniref:Zinc protease n=1 Tax=Marinobacter salinus TaxID=1874317 RepID=A0A1D9GQ51_9GAMM|nr:aminopeptidase [Marinobacter salinus]AOY89758.1 zinc protease [Marinobacter salinus]